MKKLSLLLSLGFLTFFTAFMVASVVNTKAQSETSPLQKDLCAPGPSNIYNNPNMSTEEVMMEYHKRTNEKFNWYIGTMLTKQSSSAKENIIDPDSLPPLLPDEPPGENEDPMKTFCAENPVNYSTFCVAANLLSDEKRGDGYMQYAQALDCRRGKLFETAQEETLYNEYGEALIRGEENEEEFEQVLQTQKALGISARLDAIDREIKTAKRALDQTLAAYEELKTAWPMHQRYIEIYEQLVKYRDKMVEVRHQVEEFPSKFIDATTTKCT